MCVLRNVVAVHEEQRTGETEHSCPSCAKRKSCSRRKMLGLFVNKILRVPKGKCKMSMETIAILVISEICCPGFCPFLPSQDEPALQVNSEDVVESYSFRG